jgi:hypothetical protein
MSYVVLRIIHGRAMAFGPFDQEAPALKREKGLWDEYYADGHKYIPELRTPFAKVEHYTVVKKLDL